MLICSLIWLAGFIGGFFMACKFANIDRNSSPEAILATAVFSFFLWALIVPIYGVLHYFDKLP